jgi:mannan endo-1,4-beta-mannosidase
VSDLATGFHFSDVPSAWERLRDFEASIGCAATILSIYWSWGLEDSRVPIEWMESIVRHGRRPLVTWEPWTLPEDFDHPQPSIEDPRFALSTILDGRFDDYIRAGAVAMKALPGRVYLRPMHEMNGNWYPWCGTTNGNAPRDFKLAWRHIHEIFTAQDVRNVAWVWCPYAVSVPPDQDVSVYYPGDDYVDWLGLDGYNWGDSRPWSSWQDFAELFRESYAAVTALSDKPVMIAEVGCAESGGSKAHWIREAHRQVTVSFPRVSAVVWFNLDKECDWRIESSPDALAAFRGSWSRSSSLSA